MKLMFKQGSSCQEQLPGGGISPRRLRESRTSIDESLTSLSMTWYSALVQFH